jgi:hypothetical protein
VGVGKLVVMGERVTVGRRGVVVMGGGVFIKIWSYFGVQPLTKQQGRRKLVKVGGGAGFEGHFPNKRASKNFFLEKLATGGEVSGHTKKNFPDISHFSLNMKQFFRIYQKIFRIHHIFPGNEKFFPKT